MLESHIDKGPSPWIVWACMSVKAPFCAEDVAEALRDTLADSGPWMGDPRVRVSGPAAEDYLVPPSTAKDTSFFIHLPPMAGVAPATLNALIQDLITEGGGHLVLRWLRTPYDRALYADKRADRQAHDFAIFSPARAARKKARAAARKELAVAKKVRVAAKEASAAKMLAIWDSTRKPHGGPADA